MSAITEQDYVLGTHDAEVERLRFQHEVWQPTVRAAWLAAGIGAGHRVLDCGCGPGFATLHLAEIVGALGRVVAVERSQKFITLLHNACERADYAHVDVHALDLMHDVIPARQLDAAWCRWVACFVSDPALLLARMHASLRRGGTLIMHEYVDYATYRCIPQQPAIENFVRQVIASWRATGGEPDIAKKLPRLLQQQGFQIRSARPLGFAPLPHERAWHWPAGFVRTNIPRLIALGALDQAQADSAFAELAAAEANPASIFVTPLVLEIVAEKL